LYRDYDIYTSEQIEKRVEVKENDILLIHTGYMKYGWDQPEADEVRYMVKHPGPTKEFSHGA
jgi:kynurenine formamidase